MKALLVFIMMHNYADGRQEIIYSSEPMSQVACDNMTRNVWRNEWRIVGVDENGTDVPEVDAACVKPGVEKEIGGGWRDIE